MKVRARLFAAIAVMGFLSSGGSVPTLNAQTVESGSLHPLNVNASTAAFWNAAAGQQPERFHADGTPKVELFLGYSRFGVGFNSTTGTAGNRMVGLNGGSASLAFNFNRFLALAADIGGYDDSQLQLAGSGANQPRTVNSSGTSFTYLAGPRFTLGKQRRVSVFAQVLAGGVHASAVTVNNCAGSACSPLPSQNAFAMTAGGGVDIRLTHHIALRPIQAEYMLTEFAAVPSGTSASQNDLRLSAGLVFRFGGKRMPAPAPAPVAAEVPPPPAAAVLATPPPPPMPPTISCSASPQSIVSGGTSNVTASATSASNHTLSYSYTASAGSIAGTSASAVLTAAGSDPGTITVTCTVSDDSGLTASATTMVAVTAPVQKALPQREDLCTTSFERDRRRPVRVDNEAKACLDAIALTMQHDTAGKLVIIGGYAPAETPATGLRRATNERDYLVHDKAIDPQRIEVRTGTSGTRTVSNVFLPEGSSF